MNWLDVIGWMVTFMLAATFAWAVLTLHRHTPPACPDPEAHLQNKENKEL